MMINQQCPYPHRHQYRWPQIIVLLLKLFTVIKPYVQLLVTTTMLHQWKMYWVHGKKHWSVLSQVKEWHCIVSERNCDQLQTVTVTSQL